MDAEQKAREIVCSHVAYADEILDDYDALVAAIAAALLAEQAKVNPSEELRYATQIAIYMSTNFWPKQEWYPLNTTMGVLSQIDNGLVGIKEQQAKVDRLVKAAQNAIGGFRTLPQDCLGQDSHQGYFYRDALIAMLRDAIAGLKRL